jgi:hypothetical protein
MSVEDDHGGQFCAVTVLDTPAFRMWKWSLLPLILPKAYY